MTHDISDGQPHKMVSWIGLKSGPKRSKRRASRFKIWNTAQNNVYRWKHSKSLIERTLTETKTNSTNMRRHGWQRPLHTLQVRHFSRFRATFFFDFFSEFTCFELVFNCRLWAYRCSVSSWCFFTPSSVFSSVTELLRSLSPRFSPLW